MGTGIDVGIVDIFSPQSEKKICENELCKKEFYTTKKHKKYCCYACGHKVASRKSSQKKYKRELVYDAEHIVRTIVRNPVPIHILHVVSGIYFLQWGELVVYIGMSKNIYSRICKHISEGVIQFNQASFIRISGKGVHQLENDLINIFKPKYNMDGLNYERDSNGHI